MGIALYQQTDTAQARARLRHLTNDLIHQFVSPSGWSWAECGDGCNLLAISQRYQAPSGWSWAECGDGCNGYAVGAFVAVSRCGDDDELGGRPYTGGVDFGGEAQQGCGC